jgi:hypothetical protein
MIEYEWRDCVQCECSYIEDCKHVNVELGGNPVLPDMCWRKDFIKLTPKPHHPDDNRLFQNI